MDRRRKVFGLLAILVSVAASSVTGSAEPFIAGNALRVSAGWASHRQPVPLLDEPHVALRSHPCLLEKHLPATDQLFEAIAGVTQLHRIVPIPGDIQPCPIDQRRTFLGIV